MTKKKMSKILVKRNNVLCPYGIQKKTEPLLIEGSACKYVGVTRLELATS